MNGAVSSDHEVRPRPVADAPIDELLERADELAKRWAMALLAARPLEEIERVPLAEIAALAPSLCVSVLLALRSDDALEPEASPRGSAARDPSGGGRDSLRLTWGEEPRALVAAVEALRSVLWDALVRAPGTERRAVASDRLLSDLADRLAHVCSVVLARSLPAGAGATAQAPRARTDGAIRREAPPRARAAVAAEQGNHERRSRYGPADGPGRPPRVADASAGSSRVVLVDELSEPASGAGALAHSAARPGGAASARVRASHQSEGADARPLPWDIPLGGPDAQLEASARDVSKRRTADVPSISITRRRRPRERE